MEEQIIADLKYFVLYWKTRCLLAEAYIEESPCDPDITHDQLRVYREWQDFLNKPQP